MTGYRVQTQTRIQLTTRLLSLKEEFGRVISVGSIIGPPVRARVGASGNAASKGYALGTAIVTELIGTWTPITDGEFSVYIDNVQYDVKGLDFTQPRTC